MENKVAAITGFSGQDGRYLAKFLLEKGYTVYGMVRRVSHPNHSFINEMSLHDIKLIEGDLADNNSLYEFIKTSKPDEFYNLAAMSHVGSSFHQPQLSADITGVGTLRILEQLRLHSPHTKFYQAGSSEQFGDVLEIPQNEKTEFRPRSPYAAAKVFAHHITKVYRESYGMHASVGILFNHESPHRGLTFVTKKITDWLGRYMAGLTNETLKLGYLDAKRDWGAAPDYVEGMWLMLQQEKPDDYVLATGETHSVRDFCELACSFAGMNLIWDGKDVYEKGYNLYTGELLIEINPEFYRPAEVPLLHGDFSKAKTKLNWQPKINFKNLVKWMVDSDLDKYDTEAYNNVHSKN